MSIPPPSSEPPELPVRRASLLDVVRTVLWSFLGIRRNDAMRRDTVTLRPHQVIIAGIVFAALLVATLLILVRVIISHAA